MSRLLWDWPASTVGGGSSLPHPATSSLPQVSTSGETGAVLPQRVNGGDGAMCSCGLKVRECSPPSSCKHESCAEPPSIAKTLRLRPVRLLLQVLKMERRAHGVTWWDIRDNKRGDFRRWKVRDARRDRLFHALLHDLYDNGYMTAPGDPTNSSSYAAPSSGSSEREDAR